MTRADRVKRLETLLGIGALDTPGSIYHMPLPFVLVAGLRPGYDEKGSIAENLAAALGIGPLANLRRGLADTPGDLIRASRAALAEMMRARGAVVADVPTDADLRPHFAMLDRMFAELPEGVQHAVPFACASDWFL